MVGVCFKACICEASHHRGGTFKDGFLAHWLPSTGQPHWRSEPPCSHAPCISPYSRAEACFLASSLRLKCRDFQIWSAECSVTSLPRSLQIRATVVIFLLKFKLMTSMESGWVAKLWGQGLGDSGSSLSCGERLSRGWNNCEAQLQTSLPCDLQDDLITPPQPLFFHLQSEVPGV